MEPSQTSQFRMCNFLHIVLPIFAQRPPLQKIIFSKSNSCVLVLFLLNINNESSGFTNNHVGDNTDTIQEGNGMNIIKNESGTVAIIISLLVMVVLTGLGTVAYMNAATEVKISANFQNSQRAFYAADGGIEMGMDFLESNFNAVSGWTGWLYSNNGNIFTNTPIPNAPQSFYTVLMTDDDGLPWVADENADPAVEQNRKVIITSTGTYRNPAKATISVDAYLQFEQGYDSYGGKDLTGHNSNSLRGDIDWAV